MLSVDKTQNLWYRYRTKVPRDRFSPARVSVSGRNDPTGAAACVQRNDSTGADAYAQRNDPIGADACAQWTIPPAPQFHDLPRLWPCSAQIIVFTPALITAFSRTRCSVSSSTADVNPDFSSMLKSLLFYTNWQNKFLYSAPITPCYLSSFAL